MPPGRRREGRPRKAAAAQSVLLLLLLLFTQLPTTRRILEPRPSRSVITGAAACRSTQAAHAPRVRSRCTAVSRSDGLEAPYPHLGGRAPRIGGWWRRRSSARMRRRAGRCCARCGRSRDMVRQHARTITIRAPAPPPPTPLPGARAALSELAAAVGMSVEEAVEAADGITHLEVFLQDYPQVGQASMAPPAPGLGPPAAAGADAGTGGRRMQMLGLEFFPALASLVLIQVVGGEAQVPGPGATRLAGARAHGPRGTAATRARSTPRRASGGFRAWRAAGCCSSCGPRRTASAPSRAWSSCSSCASSTSPATGSPPSRGWGS